jgi:hypothetical protein
MTTKQASTSSGKKEHVSGLYRAGYILGALLDTGVR